MTPGDPADRERLNDLLADEAVQPLSTDETSDLIELLRRFPSTNLEDFEVAAAAIHLATIERTTSLPIGLSNALVSQAERYFADTRVEKPPEHSPATWVRLFACSGWATAAALLIALVWVSWPSPELSVVQRRHRLLDTDPRRFAGESAESVRGNVVWNQERQEGYMELSGLPANDPQQYQYQLWILDKGRSHPEPLDGGIFDVTESENVVIPVRNALPVRQPTLFAVTREPPGGVVVSEAGKRSEFLVVMTPVSP